MYLFNEYKLLLGQGNVPDGGSKTKGKDGWRYPNGSWVTAADVGWKCGLTWKVEDPYNPCLFTENDIREQLNIAPSHGDLVQQLWAALNMSVATQFKARSPASLLGPCDPKCADKHWKSLSKGCSGGPVCGVPTCS